MNYAAELLIALQTAYSKDTRFEIRLPEWSFEHPIYNDYLHAHKRLSDDKLTVYQNTAAAVLLETLQKQVSDACTSRGIDVTRVAKPLLGSLDSHHINARILDVPISNEKLIIFNEGLFSFFQVIINSFVRSLDIDGRTWLEIFNLGEEKLTNYKKDKHHFINCTAEFFEAYLTKGNPFSVSIENDMVGFDKVSDQVGYIMKHPFYIFIMAHEFGHLHLGHLEESKAEQTMMEKIEVTMLSQTHMQEITADMWATLTTAQALVNADMPVIFLAFCDLCFEYLITLERSMSVLKFGVDDMITSETHPSMVLRQNVFKSFFKEHFTKEIQQDYHMYRSHIFSIAKFHTDHVIEHMWKLREKAIMPVVTLN